MTYEIERVLRKRGFVRVLFNNGEETIKIDFSDKYGQYKKFKSEKKKGETYPREYLMLYCEWKKPIEAEREGQS